MGFDFTRRHVSKAASFTEEVIPKTFAVNIVTSLSMNLISNVLRCGKAGQACAFLFRLARIAIQDPRRFYFFRRWLNRANFSKSAAADIDEVRNPPRMLLPPV
jgi:hypothetical protein